MWVWELKLKSSCLCGKHITEWAIVTLPRLLLLFMGRIFVPEASFKLTTIVTDDLEFLIFLPLPSECWGAHDITSSFYVVLGIRLRGSYMLGKHSTKRATKFQILCLNWTQFTLFSRSVHWGHTVWCALVLSTISVDILCLLGCQASEYTGKSAQWIVAGISRISMPTPMRVEGRRCNWQTEVRMAPERSPSQVQFACPFCTQKPQRGPSKQAGLPEA